MIPKRARWKLGGAIFAATAVVSAACAVGGTFLHDEDVAAAHEAPPPDVAAGDSEAPTSAPATAPALVSIDATLDAAFTPGLAILSGFDDPARGGSWRVGDAILFGVSFREGDRRSTRFVKYEIFGALPEAAKANASEETVVAARGASTLPGAAALPEVEGGRCHARLVRFKGKKAVDEVSEPSIGLKSSVYDAHGVLLGEGPISLPVAALSASFPDAVALLAAASSARGLKTTFENHKTPQGRRREMRFEPRARDGAATDADAAAADDAFLQAGYAMFGLVDSFRHNGALRDFRRRVADVVCETPSVLGAIFSGVEGELVFDPKGAIFIGDADVVYSPLDDLVGQETPNAVDATFFINGDEAMKMRFVYTHPAPPYHLSSGVVGFDARHPKHADRSIAVRVLAARRG